MEILNDIVPSPFLIFEQHTTGEPSPHGFMRISPSDPREISSWQSSSAFSYSTTIEPGHDPIGVSLIATSDAFVRANCGAGPGQFSQPEQEPLSIHSTKASSKRSSVPEFARYPGAKSIAEFYPSHTVDTNRPSHYSNTSLGVADPSIGPLQSNPMLHAFFDHEHLVYVANPWINNISHNNDIHTLEPLAMSGSNTCSDGSTNSSSDGSDHRLDHLMGFVFDENETGPLDVSWLPDQHDNNSFEHYDGGVTVSDTGQYSPDSGGLDARDIFGGSSLLVTCPIQFGPSSAEVGGGGLAVSMSPHFQNPAQSSQEHGGGLDGKPYPNSSSSLMLMPSKPKLKQGNNKEDRNPNRMFGEEASGPAVNPATIGNGMAGQGVEIRQDNTREFGLNPILGSPLARSESDYSEICLVHLLIAGAEAVATRDLDLASVILVRLTELVSCSGTTMQRVAAYFSEGLQSRIESCGRSRSSGRHGHCNVRADLPQPAADILVAFRILHEVSPYIKFGHFSANQAILEAVEREKCVHIVDFEIMEGIQWPPLMQALASRKGGPPHLRISALYRPHGRHTGLATVHETGKRLAEFAASVSVPFTFSPIPVMEDNEGRDEEFGGVVEKLGKGEEALVVNCMLHLPHMPHTTASAVSAFVRAMRTLDPILLALVEEELGCSTGSGAASSFFFEALHHYSAICDSLEDSISLSTTEAQGGPGPAARVLVERMFLAPRIHHTVSLWSRSSCPDHPVASPPETIGLGPGLTHYSPGVYNWHSLVRSAGFKPVPLSFHNLSQAKLLLGLYKDGFRLDERNDRLLLGWRTKPLFAVSIWN